jgi:multiple sugar transport system permease protein
MSELERYDAETSKRRKRIKRIKEALTGYLFISPASLILLTFSIFPSIFVFYISTLDWNMIGPKHFIGLQNYENLLFRSPYAPEFWHSVLVTVEYVVMSVPLQITISLILAVLLMKPIRFKSFFRLGIFIAYVTPLVATSIVWMWMFEGSKYGIINAFLHMLHLPTVNWLLSFPSALIAIVIYVSWHEIGFDTIIFMAGLSGVSPELKEAAEIDGANGNGVFWNVVWPLLSPTTFFILIISMIGAFKMFTPVFVMTGGGPYNSTTTMGYYLYVKAFDDWQAGYASAVAVMLFVFIFALTLLNMKFTGRKVYYAGESNTEGENEAA